VATATRLSNTDTNNQHQLVLPEPDTDAREHSTRLSALIRAEIDRAGPMPFQRYMELALYAPGLGYYAAGARKFGAQGDFITAPELGGVFAMAVAATLAPTLRRFAQPTLMEVGAGSGALAVDLLAALEQNDALPARYLILERSADLRQRQRQRIAQQMPQHVDRVAWIDAPPEQPFDGAIIGNEVVDALACVRFTIADDGPRECAVTHAGGRFASVDIEPRPHIARAVDKLLGELESPLPVGYRSELVPELSAWLAAVCAPLRHGLLLLADYGYGRPEYYRPQRRDGTLICHYRQHAHANPYWYPGLNDLSASVDFTAVAEAAADCGLELLSYDHQAGFLIGAGIEALCAHLPRLGERERLALSGELKRLMLPGEMGERFKVLLAGRGVGEELIPSGLLGAGQRRML
jgi:SAM-dependent MidA family methyltransferase